MVVQLDSQSRTASSMVGAKGKILSDSIVKIYLKYCTFEGIYIYIFFFYVVLFLFAHNAFLLLTQSTTDSSAFFKLITR